MEVTFDILRPLRCIKISAVIQARMTSRRLPGKVLKQVCGKPLLLHLLRRVERCEEIDDTILAISSDPSDDPLHDFGLSCGISVYRGSLEDVATRLSQAAGSNHSDALVRICGDSPLIDPTLIDQLVRLYRTSPSVDLVSNVQGRTFPKGQSVEVLSVKALNSKIATGLTREEKEHATLALYRASDHSKKLFVSRGPSLSTVQLSVDDQSDFETFEAIMKLLGEPYEIHDMDSLVHAYKKVKKGDGT